MSIEEEYEDRPSTTPQALPYEELFDYRVSRYSSINKLIYFHSKTLNCISAKCKINQKYIKDKRVTGLNRIAQDVQELKTCINELTTLDIENKIQAKVKKLNEKAY